MFQQAVYQGWNAIDEARDPSQLKSNELAALTNAVLTSSGEVFSIEKRGGFSQYNSNTSPLISWKAIYDVADGSGNNSLLAIGSDGTTYKSANGTGTWNNISTLSFHAGYMVRLAQYAGNCYLTDGYGTPQMTDLTTGYNILPTPPNTSSVTVSTGSGSLTGGYLWAIVYVMQDGSYSIPGQPIFANLSGNNATLASLPYSTDARVTQIYIFRTQANGMNFYYNGAQPNNTAGGTFSYTDGAADSTLDLSTVLYTNEVPTIASYILTHKDRLIFGNVTLNNIPWEVYPIGGDPALASSSAGGSMSSAATYGYKICYVEAGTGVLTGLSKAFTITLGPSDNRVAVQNIVLPFGPNVSAQLYRTKAGGSTYYYLDTVTGAGTSLSTTTYSDTKADSLLTQTYTASPSTATYLSTLTISEPAQMALHLNTFDVAADDGNPITALADDGDGVLVWKKNALYKLYSIGPPSQWVLIKIPQGIGTDSQELVVKVPDGYVFISKNKVYEYVTGMRAVNPIPVSESRRATFATATSFVNGTYNFNEAWIAYSAILNSTASLLVFDLKIKQWYVFKLPGSSIAWIMTKQIGNDQSRFLVTLDTTGRLAYYDTTASVDNFSVGANSAITVSATMAVINAGDGISLMRPRILQVNRDLLSGQSITHTITDVDSGTALTYTDSATSGLSVIKTPTDAMSGGTINTSRRLQYSCSGAGITQLQSVKIEYRPVNRGTRLG